MSDEAENQNSLAMSGEGQPKEEQITKNPLPTKGKPKKEKDPKKVAAGKKLAEKNRQAKEALAREIKREQEMAERSSAQSATENDNSSPGWFPELTFPTVLSIAGIIYCCRIVFAFL